MSMVVAFRVDASLTIGTGHVMRCLVLADNLRRFGAECTFICRPHTGHLINFISSCGHSTLVLPELKSDACKINFATQYEDWLGLDWESDAVDTQYLMAGRLFDWIVVDHYALDHRWEKILRRNARRIMSIDDLADRPHDCDLLLDQTLGRTISDYSNLVSSSTISLMGPQYALLRPEFAELRPYSLKRRNSSKLKNILISMGGVDKDNSTEKVLDVINLCSLPQDLSITVVMGKNAPWLAKVKVRAEQMQIRTQVMVDVRNMAQLMMDSDLAIGAAGGSAWERCCLGLPSLILILAENQERVAVALENIGAAILIKRCDEIPRVINDLTEEDSKNNTLLNLAQVCAEVTDGLGCDRLTQLMRCERD